MPEYFFHVALELFQTLEPDGEVQKCAALTQTLSPFIKGRDTTTTLNFRPLNIASSRKGPSQNQSQARNAPCYLPSQNAPSCPKDQRLDDITIESMDMTKAGKIGGTPATNLNGDRGHVSTGIGTAIHAVQTKGKYVPLDQGTTESVWGIVHLYRDAEETPGLYGDSPLGKPTDPWLHGLTRDTVGPKHSPPADQDCTTLCVLAVPSYMPPSDFLGFVGEETVNEVSHFRMVRTARANRYMVLMKFRHGKKAREWQQEWNGKVFNSIEVRL